MKVFYSVILLNLLLLLCSWGEKGHQKINGSTSQYFPTRLNRYNGWSEKLAEHGSDPDKRRRTDPTEEIKHYIDIDAYTDFVQARKIVEGKEEAFNRYGKEFIKKNGTLPWVTDSTYRELVKQFRDKEWSRAVLTASDLGHYVGDGHMPLHLTLNYDGQLTEQKGIHSRYESKMINLYIDSITVKRSRLHKVKNVNRYVFDYMYQNYQYKDSLLKVDLASYSASNLEYNDLYYTALWRRLKEVTHKLIVDSSKATAELIRTAWIEAGRPRFPREISF
jgi:hypothetical protein